MYCRYFSTSQLPTDRYLLSVLDAGLTSASFNFTPPGVARVLLNRDQIVEKDQILGEYKLRLRQFGSENHENTQIQLADKQKTTSEAIGMADVTAKMILLEQKAQNAEAKLEAKVQELQIRGKTISRLEEKLRRVLF